MANEKQSSEKKAEQAALKASARNHRAQIKAERETLKKGLKAGKEQAR